MQYSIKDLAQMCHGLIFNERDITISHMLTDSRRLFEPEGTLFVALKGERHDGAQYISDLYARGIRAFLVNEGADVGQCPEATFIVVPDTLKALGQIAAMHRLLINPIVVAIIGSNGKTTLKEWAASILGSEKRCVRSPRSYNSQVGVPLSLLNIRPDTEVAIIEAGISKPGEMEKLEEMVHPNVVVITNIGQAHQENFKSMEQKLDEKLKMCRQAAIIICREDDKMIYNAVKKKFKKASIASWRMTSIKGGTTPNSYEYMMEENMGHAIHLAMVMGIAKENVLKHYPDLKPIDMRLQQKEGHNNCTILNDSYSSDIESTEIALDMLYTMGNRKDTTRTVILSDMEQMGIPDKELYERVGELLRIKKVDRLIGIGEHIQRAMAGTPNARFFASTDEFLSSMSTGDFSNEAILIKGARSFGFERIVDRLEQKSIRTEMQINLDALAHNIAYYRSKLKPETKLLAMVKAYSYGTGSFEIAKLMQAQGVDYLGVAFADEGVELRKAGITLPIIVMNPEVHSFDTMLEYGLEPQIYSVDDAQAYNEAAVRMGIESAGIHIKVNTGMNRSGFDFDRMASAIVPISKMKNLMVRSAFSHLVGSDEEQFDSFTLEQIEKFKNACEFIEGSLGYSFTRHILNSAGIERFSEHQMEMVRLGIGLYGYGFTPEAQQQLKNVCTLKSYVSQIREVEAGESVGYSRKTICTRPTKLAVVPIGYADGINRRLSNGVGEVLINGHKAPIAGNVCMDICMVDVTDIQEVEIGDEVQLFGDENPVWEMSDKIGTIPYEVLTSIGRRVKRVYYVE